MLRNWAPGTARPRGYRSVKIGFTASARHAKREVQHHPLTTLTRTNLSIICNFGANVLHLAGDSANSNVTIESAFNYFNPDWAVPTMKTVTWVKMLAGYVHRAEVNCNQLTNISGAAMCVGGPALVYYVMPTEEELFQVCCSANVQQPTAHATQRYNPELQRRSLENRHQKQEDFDKFVTKLKEYSKSDKPSTSSFKSGKHLP